MSGKSLEEVWRQMQAQRAQQQAQQQAQERNINEQREIARQEYIRRMRMNELVNYNPAASAPGAGGGSRVNITATKGQSILYSNFEGDKFTYFIYNFEMDILTDIKTINLPSNPDIAPITNGGFILISEDKLLFIELKGDVIWEETSDDYSGYVESVSRFAFAEYTKNGKKRLSMFDENNKLTQIDFDNDFYLSERDSSDEDPLWLNGLVITEESDTKKISIIKNGLNSPILIKESNTALAYVDGFSDTILTFDNNVSETWDSDGNRISSFDCSFLEPGEEFSFDFVSFLRDNSIVINLNGNNINLILFYSGNSKEFSYKQYPSNTNLQYSTTQINFHEQDDYDRYGTAIISFNNDSVLPIWSSDAELREESQVATGDYIAVSKNQENILTVIESKKLYFFSDEGFSNQISDGGDDMYDGGNEIYVGENQVAYTHTQADVDRDGGLLLNEFLMDGQISGASPSVFGEGSNYFTNLYPGLFVLASENINIPTFRTDGNIGADGGGYVDGYQFTKGEYEVFVKRTWGTTDPSINKIIIVKGSTSSISYTFDEDTQDDDMLLTNTEGINELYYLLTATHKGVKLTNQEIENLVDNFITSLGGANELADLLNILNSSFQTVTDFLDEPTSNYRILKSNILNNDEIIDTNIPLEYRYDIDNQLGNKSTILFEETITPQPGEFGWDNLNNIESRRYVTFFEATDNLSPSEIINKELVLKDVQSDKYWGIKFIDFNETAVDNVLWSYERRLISGGEFTGPTVSFTSNNESQQDVIEAGILALSKNERGSIFNSLLENYSDYNPEGTLWNSDLVYDDYIEKVHVIVSPEGQEIDKIRTPNFTNTISEGCVSVISNGLVKETWVTNNLNDKRWTKLDSFYDNYENTREISTGGLTFGNILLTNIRNDKFIIITNDSISEEFSPVGMPPTAFDSNKYESGISENFVYFTLPDEEDPFKYCLSFYNLNGELIAKKSIPTFNGFDIEINSNLGKRIFITYNKENGDKVVLLFNGKEIKEVDTGLESIDKSINDYGWWN